MNEKKAVVRATGLLIIEVVNSNPNGDPDRESDPRTRSDRRGLISPVSFKRKVRDLLDAKDGPVWQDIQKRFDLDSDRSQIFENPTRDREAIKAMDNETLLAKYWDARVFGCTFLEKEEKAQHLATGVVQFGLGLSIAPITIERLTNTNRSGVQAGKDRGMAPLAYRIVEHGVYAMPFFVNASAAAKTKCATQDITVLLALIPWAYSLTGCYIRPSVEIRHAWYIEHKSPLGSASDLDLIGAMMPRRLGQPGEPSASWADYEVPLALPVQLQVKVEPMLDLMEQAYAVAGA